MLLDNTKIDACRNLCKLYNRSMIIHNHQDNIIIIQEYYWDQTNGVYDVCCKVNVYKIISIQGFFRGEHNSAKVISSL